MAAETTPNAEAVGAEHGAHAPAGTTEVAAAHGGAGTRATLAALTDNIQARLRALREIAAERAKPRAVVRQVTGITLAVLGVTLITKNAILPLPVAWGYLGIYQSLNAADGFAGAYPILAMTALVGIGMLAVMIGVQFYFNRWQLLPVVKHDRATNQ